MLDDKIWTNRKYTLLTDQQLNMDNNRRGKLWITKDRLAFDNNIHIFADKHVKHVFQIGTKDRVEFNSHPPPHSSAKQ